MFAFRKLAPVVLSVCLFLIFNGKVHASEKGPEFSRVVVKEGSDAILPCSLSTEENIESKLFDWKKDGRKEVFFYDGGKHYNNGGKDGQDVQFKGRVSHFPDQLKNGNASIKIQNTKVADRGNYTCVFPRLQPSQTFYIELVVVERTFKDKSAGMVVAAREPNVKILDATKKGVRLQCDVQGAFPEPKVEWQDRAGNILPAEEPQVSYKGERYYITLLTTVTKTDHYHCVVTQEEIHHQTEAETFVPFCGAPTGWIVAVSVLGTLLLVSVVGNVLYHKGIIKVDHTKGRLRQENGSEKPPMCEKPLMCEKPPVSDNEQGNGLHTDPLLNGSAVPAQTSPV